MPRIDQFGDFFVVGKYSQIRCLTIKNSNSEITFLKSEIKLENSAVNVNVAALLIEMQIIIEFC